MYFNDKLYAEITRQAQQLITEERKPNYDPSMFDFTPTVVCMYCDEWIDLPPGKKALTCSKCKSPMYCSRECGTAHWSKSKVPGAQPHKQLCIDNQRHLLRLPETHAILKQFPWGRIEKDGTFSDRIAKGRFRVLGTSKMGFWSHRGSSVTHSTPSNFETLTEEDLLEKSLDHLDGLDLLDEIHLSDEDGWKLQSRLIPFRTFSVVREPPLRPGSPKAQNVTDWKSWYKWRGLSLESPAALLMHYPLTIYWFLVNTLKVTSPKVGSPQDRKTLVVHYIGAETELNFLPIFSELALLLPYHDIKLIIFGSVPQLLEQAKKKPKSLIAKSSPTSSIFHYEAPKESGSGTLSIYFHKSPAWTPADAIVTHSTHAHLYQSNSQPKSKPDAIVALNAGLASYTSWYPVIVWALATNTPFGATDYSEQSCETQRQLFIPLLNRQGRYPGSVYSGPGAPTPRQCAEAIVRIEERMKKGMDCAFLIELNPFQRPGQRPGPAKVPNAPNGFTQRVAWNGE